MYKAKYVTLDFRDSTEQRLQEATKQQCNQNVNKVSRTRVRKSAWRSFTAPSETRPNRYMIEVKKWL